MTISYYLPVLWVKNLRRAQLSSSAHVGLTQVTHCIQLVDGLAWRVQEGFIHFHGDGWKVGLASNVVSR